MKANLCNAFLGAALFFRVVGPTEMRATSCWGRLANPGFDGDRIKTTLFFAGQANDGSKPYECDIPCNLTNYTLNPVPRNTHLNWTNPANRDVVMNLMTNAGINVISMSSWGEDFLTKTSCADGWPTGIPPMQTSPKAHDDLFTAASNKRLLIVPFIESRATWTMRDEFPRWTDGRVAPGLVSQITNLIQRYLQNPAHPEWSNVWATVYDHNGTPRHAVTLIHAVSNRVGIFGDVDFAAGFDLVANEVAQATGVQVGFFIDAIPPDVSPPFRADFKPSSGLTGPPLRSSSSFLGIQCFIPEIFSVHTENASLLAWKRNFVRSWFATGIPVLVDVSPGYDGRKLFGEDSKTYGLTDEWLQELTPLVDDYGRAGMVYNSWNGYTEGMVGVPTEEKVNSLYDWLTSLNSTQAIHVDHNYGSTGWGTVSEPFQTVATAVAEACNRDFVRVHSGTYHEPMTIQKPLTFQAEGGSVTIGN